MGVKWTPPPPHAPHATGLPAGSGEELMLGKPPGGAHDQARFLTDRASSSSSRVPEGNGGASLPGVAAAAPRRCERALPGYRRPGADEATPAEGRFVRLSFSPWTRL